MADERIGNGVASDVDYTDFGKDAKVLELNRKIEVLEQENSGLIREKEESYERIKELMEEIEGFKTDGTELKDRLEQRQMEIEQSSEEKKALQVVSAHAFELETQVSRLQHDLVSSMTESEEAAAEVRRLNNALEELKQSNLNKEAKVEELEKEKASLLERIEREVGEMKKFKFETEKLQKEKDEIEKLKSSLEEALKRSQEKVMETKTVADRLLNELEESEKLVKEFKELNLNCTATARELDAADAEKGSKGLLQLQWPTVVASTGTVAAAAALFYLSYAKRR
ncbi:hypothetical protein NE237_033196 [Protea cynaroides]|uniref:Uncharacterized protein n=1 Tax=Protea cynaroides TaxID=273540 RepID=A0A9Q0L654_9MAGN|nr:hypothetical protein NE237_033196 [Protea cynaroides]